MYSLLLDSSNVDLAVGLAKDNILIDNIKYEAWQRQSEFMISEIANILKRNRVDPKDIEEIVVTKGPGSYTGLRIALTIAKIYGYALNIKVYALSSLAILKDKDNISICLMNARSKRSYFGLYQNKTCLIEDKVLTNEEVLAFIKEHPNYSICGDVSYLNLENKKNDIFNNMLELKDEDNLVKNILSLKAVYLKD